MLHPLHDVSNVQVLPIDLVSGCEALLVPLESFRELQTLVEGPFIGQQPLQGARRAVAWSGCRGSGGGHPAGPAAAAQPQAEGQPLP